MATFHGGKYGVTLLPPIRYVYLISENPMNYKTLAQARAHKVSDSVASDSDGVGPP